MKKIIIKTILGCVLLACVVLNSFGQSAVLPNNQGGDNPESLDRRFVPGSVTNSYVQEYPNSTYETWYYYPGYSSTEGDWYDYNPYSTVMDNDSQYYAVEFNFEKNPYRVVYFKDGKKVTTYKTTKTDLPKAVITTLSKSTYKSWTIAKEIEEIWKDMDKKKIYKVTVEKGKEKHALYYQENGKLVKDRILKS